MSDEEKDNVEKPLDVTVKRGKWCNHNSTAVCGEDRTVTCNACGAVLDPLDVLMKYARYRERLVFENKHARNEINRLQTVREDLERQVRNLKGTIRRRTPKTEPAPPENVTTLRHRLPR
jgi:hypothetical protein